MLANIADPFLHTRGKQHPLLYAPTQVRLTSFWITQVRNLMYSWIMPLADFIDHELNCVPETNMQPMNLIIRACIFLLHACVDTYACVELMTVKVGPKCSAKVSRKSCPWTTNSCDRVTFVPTMFATFKKDMYDSYFQKIQINLMVCGQAANTFSGSYEPGPWPGIITTYHYHHDEDNDNHRHLQQDLQVIQHSMWYKNSELLNYSNKTFNCLCTF